MKLDRSAHGRRYRGGEGEGSGVTHPNNSKRSKVGQNGTNICLKLKVKFVKFGQSLR
jgi:hypothetical protein